MSDAYGYAPNVPAPVYPGQGGSPNPQNQNFLSALFTPEQMLKYALGDKDSVLGKLLGSGDSAPPRPQASVPGATPAANSAAPTGSPPGTSNVDDYLWRTAQIESGGNPGAWTKGSKYRGLYQLGPDEMARYGVSNWQDPDQQRHAASGLYWDNRNYLANKLGRDPTDAEVYLAHQQGPAGALALIQNPDAPAAQTMGRWGNGLRRISGNLPRSWGLDPSTVTGQQFVDAWAGRYNRVGGIGMPATAPAASQLPHDPVAGQGAGIPLQPRPGSLRPMTWADHVMLSAPAARNLGIPSDNLLPPPGARDVSFSGAPPSAAPALTPSAANMPLPPPPPRVATKAAVDALPSGALFVTPDGKVRRKP